MPELPGQSNSRVRCFACERGLDVDFGACMADGWPKCCGATMVLVKSPGEAGIEAALRAHPSVSRARALNDQLNAITGALRSRRR